MEKQEKTYDKFEKLQLELEVWLFVQSILRSQSTLLTIQQAQQKINERLVRDINEAKADSEFFARQAKVKLLH